jgi:hypothetical protein
VAAVVPGTVLTSLWANNTFATVADKAKGPYWEVIFSSRPSASLFVRLASSKSLYGRWSLVRCWEVSPNRLTNILSLSPTQPPL